MPFTPAHSAIVLPFIRKRYFSATGLIIGSFAPDFEYFIKLNEQSEHSHTVAGIFYFNVPITILLAYIFHHVVKRNLISNLPVVLQTRFQDTVNVNFVNYFRRRYWTFLISAVAGAFSHIFWDAFTHYEGFFAQNLWFYHGSYFPFEGVNYPLWYALQHISTYIGLFIVMLYLIFKKPQPVEAQSPRILYWVLVITIPALMIWLRFTWFPEHYTLGNLVITGITGTCIGVIVGGLIPFSRTGRWQRNNA